MADLIESFMGLREPRMPTDGFQSVLGEMVRGKFGTVGSAAARDAALAELASLRKDQNGADVPLNANEQAEATAIVTSITSLQAANRINRVLEIRDVLMLAELSSVAASPSVPSYNTPAKVRAKLGI